MSATWSGMLVMGSPLVALALAESVSPELGNLTASAVLGWYAWYTATRTMPGMLRTFRDEMSAARQDFRQDSAALREQLACEREYRHRDNAAMARALNRLSRATARVMASSDSEAQAE